MFVAKCVVRLSRVADEIIWPHILSQTGSILGDIGSENKQLVGDMLLMACPPLNLPRLISILSIVHELYFSILFQFEVNQLLTSVR